MTIDAAPTIENDFLRARINPAQAMISHLEVKVGTEFVHLGGSIGGTATAIFLGGGLWCNRSDQNVVFVRGERFQCAHPKERTDGLHSYLTWFPHKLADSSENHAELEFVCSRDAAGCPTPSDFRVVTQIWLKGPALHMRMVMQNLEDGVCPAGLYTHPVFLKKFGRDQRPLLHFRACSRYVMRDNLPTGELVPVEGDFDYATPRLMVDGADDCLRGFDGRMRAIYPQTGYCLQIEDAYGNCCQPQLWTAFPDVWAFELQNSPANATHLRQQGFLGLGDVELDKGGTFAVHHVYTWGEMPKP